MIRYQIKWTNNHLAGDICIFDKETGNTFQYHDTKHVDWLFDLVDSLNASNRRDRFKGLRLVVNNA